MDIRRKRNGNIRNHGMDMLAVTILFHVVCCLAMANRLLVVGLQFLRMRFCHLREDRIGEQFRMNPVIIANQFVRKLELLSKNCQTVWRPERQDMNLLLYPGVGRCPERCGE